jgi:hypothetical protein
MKSFAPPICLIVTGCLMLAGFLLLTAGHLEYCGTTDLSQPQVSTQAATGAPAPTLAPPAKVVFVRVEVDKSDLEVAWLND